MILNLCSSEMKSKFRFYSIGSIWWIAFSQNEIKSAEDIDSDSMKYFRVLHKELLEHGIYMGPSGYDVGFISEAHTNEMLNNAAEVFVEALKISLK